MFFYLLRHGQTDWNIQKKVQGRTDIPLNGAGIRQAEKMAEAMDGIPLSGIWASTLVRAAETAEILQKRREKRGEEIRLTLLPELKEVAFGDWEGKTLKEVEKLFPEDYHRWTENPAFQTPTGGEKREELTKRAADAVEKMVKSLKDSGKAGKKDAAAIVAHGGILVYVIAYLLRKETERREIIVENASITKVEYDPETGTGRLVFMNDISHLSQDERTPWKADLRKKEGE